MTTRMIVTSPDIDAPVIHAVAVGRLGTPPTAGGGTPAVTLHIAATSLVSVPTNDATVTSPATNVSVGVMISDDGTELMVSQQ